MYNTKQNVILQPVSSFLPLQGLDGSVYLKDAKGEFSGIDNDFMKFRSNNKKTDAIECRVWELTKTSKFIGMFQSFNLDLSELLFTEHQIVEFSTHYSEYFGKSGYMTFFLIESADKKLKGTMDAFSVSGFGFASGRSIPHAQLYPFKRSSVDWVPYHKTQIVVPAF